jgi:hypothetical protein
VDKVGNERYPQSSKEKELVPNLDDGPGPFASGLACYREHKRIPDSTIEMLLGRQLAFLDSP